MRTGVLLAGGASSRFGGTPKGLTELQGTPLVTRVAHALRPAVDELLLVLAPGAAEAPWREALARVPGPLRVVRDPSPHAGPAAALLAALPGAGPLVAVAPCDAPRLSPALYEGLWARLDAAGADAAVPRAGGFPHPLTAVYRRDALGHALAEGLAAGDASVRGALARLQVAWLAADPAALVDVDTREDLTRLEADR